MKVILPLARARDVAEDLVACFRTNAKRIEVAGSIRRRKPQIGDIELVCIPTVELYEELDQLLRIGAIQHTTPKRWGNRYRSFRHLVKVLDEYVQVDLFLQPDPSTWGVNMLLRTGSAEFSRKMVTKRSEGGFMPDCYQVRDARIWAGAKLLETPEEEDIFALWGMDYVLPPQRTDHYAPKLRQAPTVEVEPEPVQIGLFA